MGRSELFPQRVEGVRTPREPDPDTLRMCATERDAFLGSVTLSGLTYEEIAARIGVTKQAVHKWGREGVPHNRVRAFCNATGALLLDRFLAREKAMKAVLGRTRETDRIAAIVAPTMQAWGQVA